MTRTSRRRRPDLEGLEGRRLLNGDHGHGHSTAERVNGPTQGFAYTTPAGAHVTALVVGRGQLAGTSVDPDGALNLVYGGTNALSKITVSVRGGTAPLRSVRNTSLPIDNLTGVGGQVLGALLAPGLDLVPGGSINLTSGIGRLQLHSTGANTQVHLRELPQSIQPGSNPGPLSSGTGATLSGSPTTFSGSKPLPPGTFAVAAGLPATNVAPTTYSSAGRTLSYSNDANGGSTLTGVSGSFVPTGNLVVVPVATPPATPVAPPGIVVDINRVAGMASGSGTLGQGQIFGYDPVADALIRFDVRSGTALQAIPVGGTSTNVAGLGLGRNGSEQVILLGRGTTVQAFDAASGAAVGSFSTANLAGLGIHSVGGIASNGTFTVLTDPNGQLVPGSADFGVALPIDVRASLATGQAQAAGAPFGTTRGFELAGGAAGVPGSNTIDLLGGAHFDTFQPTLNQLGVLAYNPTSAAPRETSRTAITVLGSDINAGPAGAARTGPSQALGTFGAVLGRVTSVSNGRNNIALYLPSTLAPAGTASLADPNRLAALSGTVHPELAGSSLFDIQGNTRSFSVVDARGLALYNAGNLDLIKLIVGRDSTIVGQPVSHVRIVSRQNVTVLSSPRSVGTRGDVLVDPTVAPLGPLTLPY